MDSETPRLVDMAHRCARTRKKASLSTYVADLTITDSMEKKTHGRLIAGMDTGTGAVLGSAADDAKTGSERVQTVVRCTTRSSTSTVAFPGSLSEVTNTWSKDGPDKGREVADPPMPLAYERTTDTDMLSPSRGEPTYDRPSNVPRKRLRETESDGEPEEPGEQYTFPKSDKEENVSEKDSCREGPFDDVTNLVGTSKARAQEASGAGAIPAQQKSRKGDHRPNLNFFDETYCDIFRHDRYRQRSRDNDELQDSGIVDHPDTAKLSVGCEIISMEISLDDRVRYTVYDFRRGAIVVDWKEGLFGSITPATRRIHACHKGPNGEEVLKWIEDNPWVRRDPNL